VLRSYKGPNGGFTFIAPPERITVYDMIELAGRRDYSGKRVI